MRVFGLMSLFLSLPLFASTELTTQIYDVDYGHKAGDEVLVLLTSGHVAKMRQTNKILMDHSFKEKTKNKWFRVNMDDERFITELEQVQAPFTLSKIMKPSTKKALFNYVPTTIESMDVAKKYHREARYNPKESQCFNRAQVWTYEWWKKHSLRSNKIWIYFTRNYIRRYDFEWWFHIAPLVHVMDNGKVVERAMDIKYSRGPLTITKWANLFLRNDAPCNVITKFSDYADYPYSGECYLQRSNMYMYQPADLQMNEAWGYTKDSWNMSEVRQAYLEAYDEHI